MNGGSHISQEDLALYGMQALEEEELRAVRAHLPTCADCRKQLKEIAGDLTALALSVEQHPVSSEARQRFLSSISSVVPVQTSPTAPTTVPIRGAVTKTAWVPWAIAAALAIATVGLGLNVKVLREQLRGQLQETERVTEQNAQSQRILSLLKASSAQRVTLTASKQPLEPSGHAIYLAERGELIFQGSHLKSLPEGKTYELWIIPSDGRSPIPAGLFRPDESGEASLMMPTLPVGVKAKAFGVTIEELAGSSKPTMPIVLSGTPNGEA
ncbi:MAG: anti-sigma factor [Edaphobacter sp.]|uniref:anti-sigma factor n=1 Tax=Edaphobacter sp. TaxID=1934404 RepID=UPI00239FD249|nr:anti-sigma factor [Edaphobacter sp.]MDE1175015.1 anti-sigma factor [Edaphobacter sp.]